MRIKEFIYQYRRDFEATFECEQCGFTYDGKGYDDANFHENVIPHMKCAECGKTAPDTYRPMATKYPEGFQI